VRAAIGVRGRDVSRRRSDESGRDARSTSVAQPSIRIRVPSSSTPAVPTLVAVILSAQATDKSVNLATRELFPVADTPQQMVALGVDGLIPYIKTIGLFRTRRRT
jgi:endonuclease III